MFFSVNMVMNENSESISEIVIKDIHRLFASMEFNELLQNINSMLLSTNNSMESGIELIREMEIMIEDELEN